MVKRGNNKNIKRASLENLFTELLSRSRDLLYKYNLSTDQYEYLSDSVELLTGYSPKAFLEQPAVTLFELLHPEDKPKLTDLYEGLKTDLLKNLNITIEYRVRHQSGHFVWISDNIHAIQNEQGRTTSIVGNARDVTSYKELQKLFEQNKELNQLLTRNLTFAYFRTKIADGKLLDCNDTLWRLLGYKSKEECIEKCYLSEYYQPESREAILKKLTREGHLTKTQLQATLNGHPVWIEFSAKIFPPQGYIEGVFREISILKILTPTELKILKLVLEGKCNKEIAQELHRSIRTIEDHRAHIMRKLNVHNLAELVLKAAQIFS